MTFKLNSKQPKQPTSPPPLSGNSMTFQRNDKRASMLIELSRPPVISSFTERRQVEMATGLHRHHNPG